MRARDLIRQATPALEAAGIDTARLDAELLVAHAIGIERSRLFLDDPELDAAQRERAEALLAARAEHRIPVAQLVGAWWFDGHELEVTADVLVPRPETELLVERTAELAPHGAGVIDVGTGSGAIAIALAARRPDLTITASDVSEAALAVARRNAAAVARAERTSSAPPATEEVRSAPWLAPIAFQHASLLGAWRGEVVISNPPYVEDDWRAQASPELAHEPELALYAGADGLDVIRALVAQCAAHAEVALVLLEHGHQQGAAIRDLLAEAGFPDPITEPDLAGHDRMTWARRG
ncbi:MAG: peptide chain release factor N(5)-glutamine methyltransferase [Solirubrobacteraceae bacterium]|nr:peptide chain release factor N(5)-glutamine methyltransferase [Solirubrobacteraceae bacterium]